MAGLSDATTRLSVCMTSLTAAQVMQTAAVDLAAEIHEALLELGAEGTAANIETVVEGLRGLGQTLDQSETTVSDVMARLAAIAQDKLGDAGNGGISGRSQTGRVDVTSPSRRPDPHAVPRGEPEESLGHAGTQAAIRKQNLAAQALARAGYEIEQLTRRNDRKSPDFRIEGRIFDCYAPQGSTSLENIRSKLRRKIGGGQARRFVVLDQNGVSGQGLRDFLAHKAPGNLEEVLVVEGNRIERVWP